MWLSPACLHGVKGKFSFTVVHGLLVGRVKVLWQHNVAVLPYCLKTSFGANRTNICRRYLFTSINVIFQVEFIAQVHQRRGSLEDHTLLFAVLRSNQPGHNKAGSKGSARFVAMMTLILVVWSQQLRPVKCAQNTNVIIGSRRT
jgi:hypothetical protein